MAVVNADKMRDRLWWQMDQMTCPTREADSHIPFLKSQLKLLEDTANQVVESYITTAKSLLLPDDEDFEDKTDAIDDKGATYHTHLKQIFGHIEVSFTSLNIKSLQCSILFTLMIKTQDDEINKINRRRPNYNKSLELVDDMDPYMSLFNEFYPTLSWTNYGTMLAYCSKHLDFKNLIFEEEASPCIPDCKNKAIITLLGEMSIYELVWSLTNNVYFIGLPTAVEFADNSRARPLSFVNHDLLHLKDRIDAHTEYGHGSIDTENANVKKCLLYIADKSKEIQDTVLFIIFLFIHGEIEPLLFLPPTNLLIHHTDKTGIFVKETAWYSLIVRLKRKRDLNGFLPDELKEEQNDDVIKTWLEGQWRVFCEHWNASLDAADIPAGSMGPNANTVARYKAKTMENAANWNRMHPRVVVPVGGAGASSNKGGSRRRRQTRQKKQKKRQSRKH